MGTSRPLPNLLAPYLLSWALMSWSVARFWRIQQDQLQNKPAGDEAEIVRPSADRAAREVSSDEEALTPDEEVGLLHILE